MRRLAAILPLLLAACRAPAASASTDAGPTHLVLFVVAIGASVPLLQAVQARIPDRPFIRQAGVPAIQAVLLVVSYAYLLDSTFNPFLYFRF